MRCAVFVACLSAACATKQQYGAEAHHEEYHAPMRQEYAPAHVHVEVAEYHIHPPCSSGGPTPMRMEAQHSGYRNLRTEVDRTLFEDDLELPADDIGCGHGICVMAPGGTSLCTILCHCATCRFFIIDIASSRFAATTAAHAIMQD